MNLTIEASDELASQIAQLHLEAESRQSYATESINELIEARINVAALVETAKEAKGNRFGDWWKDHNLPNDWAGRYLTIAKTASRAKLMDKNQMRLIGILPESNEDNKEPQQRRESNPLEWIKIAGKLSTSLNHERIKDMDEFQRRLAIDKLKPLISIYRELGGE